MAISKHLQNAQIHHLDEHGISFKDLDRHAVNITKRLQEAGYQAYLVGGCVRDLLLGLHPKDFDVATNAEPEQIAKLFRNCRLIGRRFRLAHLHYGRDIIEVATFRGPSGESNSTLDKKDKTSRVLKDGRLLRDNVYGTMEEDAWRRDFTVNALYLDPQTKTIIDFTNGLNDHQAKSLQLMGEPVARYKEDPVRLLRAIRFSAKLDFTIAAESETPIAGMATLLKDIPAARLYEEVLKLFLNKDAQLIFELLQHYNVFEVLFPQTEYSLLKAKTDAPLEMLKQAMLNTQERLMNDKGVAPYFMFAVLLWEPIRQIAEKNGANFASESLALHAAANDVLSKQVSRIALPRRLTTPMREVWTMQPRFLKRVGMRSVKFLEHPRFRAAYDFMLLRSEIGEVDPEIAEWWTKIQTVSQTQKKAMTRPKRPQKKSKPQQDAAD